MDQPTSADLEYRVKEQRSRREVFLEQTDGLIPWQPLEDGIGPFCPKPGRGRRSYQLAVMLRIRCVRLFYNRRDPGGVTLVWRSCSTRPRRFVGLRLSEPLPDETELPLSPGEARAEERDPEMRQGGNGKPGAFRDEGSHRGVCEDELNAQHVHDASQRE